MKTLTKKSIKDILAMMGAKRDDWQIDIPYQTFKKKNFYLSGPRQIGKTTASAETAFILALKGLKVLYLTHKADNARDVMGRVLAYANQLVHNGVVTRIQPSNGFTRIEFSSGGEIAFRVRGPGVSVGLTFDCIIWDEAQKISPEIIEEVKPILSVSKYRLQLFIGTPPTEKDRAYNPNGPFMLAKQQNAENYVEFSCAEKYSEDIEISYENMIKANPAAKRLPGYWEFLQEEAKNMDHESFCRQYFGVWHDTTVKKVHDPYLTSEQVNNMLTEKGSVENSFTASIGISANSNFAYIAMNDGVVSEIVQKFELDLGGLDDVIDWVSDPQRLRTIKVIRIPSTARGKAIAEELKSKRLGNKIKVVSLPEFSNNLSRFLKQAEEGSLKVYKENEVKLALASFWLGYEPRSGSYDIKSGIYSDAAILMALVNSTVDKKLMERSRGAKAWVF